MTIRKLGFIEVHLRFLYTQKKFYLAEWRVDFLLK